MSLGPSQNESSVSLNVSSLSWYIWSADLYSNTL